jgi:dTMP kinase
MSFFITFEGGEGAGKSTQIDRLRRRLEAGGRRVKITREPGGSDRAEEIRDVILSGRAKAFGPLAEAVLFSAARIDHVERTIRPALAQGMTVLCDRFADSMLAYQGALGHVKPSLLSALERVAIDGTRPDLTLILDLPAEVGLARARSRAASRGEGVDRFEAEASAFHEALRQAFLDIAAQNPNRCAVIDADREADAVEASIWAEISRRLPALAVPAKVVTHVA